MSEKKKESRITLREPSESLSRAIARTGARMPSMQTIDVTAEAFGKHNFIRMMRLCLGDPKIAAMVNRYDMLPLKDRRKVSLDDLCLEVKNRNILSAKYRNIKGY